MVLIHMIIIKEYDEMTYFMEEPYFASHQFGLIKPIKTVEIDFENPITKKKTNIFYFKNDDINKLNPNYIDNSLFWNLLHKIGFEFSPVSGALSKTIKELNENNEKIFKYLVDNNQNLFKNKQILEIGYGYCSFIEYLRKNDIDIYHYYGIDLIKRFKKRYDKRKFDFYECDGWSIPENVDNLDLIFSSNTFQHITKDQKLNYLKLGYEKLKTGGYFVFTSFFSTPDLLVKKPYLWAFKDEIGKPYVHFFDQFIQVDDYYEITRYAISIGYKFEFGYNYGENLFAVILKK